MNQLCVAGYGECDKCSGVMKEGPTKSEILGEGLGSLLGGGGKRFHSRGPVWNEVAMDSKKSCTDFI